MSFFDDDEPIRASRTRPARPRAPTPGGSRALGGDGSGSSGGGTRRPDPATARQRQLVLGGGALVLFVLLVVLVSSCQSSRKENALKDYNRAVTELAADSDKVGVDFFAALDAAAAGGDVEVRVNELRATADEHVERAKGLDPRDELARAQSNFELVLNLRAEGLRKIGEKLPSALVSGRDNAQAAETAVTQIAGQMQQFLASDVIYSQRTAPFILEAFNDADVSGQRVVRESHFLPSLGWLDPNTVAGRLGAERAGGGTGADPNPSPGLHGHSLTSVKVGSTTLEPGGTINRVPARPAPAFTVEFENGGDSDEREVVVTARVAGGSGRPVPRRKTIAQTKTKASATVTIPLGASPPAGAATLTITVGRVPGEEETANNRQTYTILFT